jgi:hypothetical protein
MRILFAAEEKIFLSPAALELTEAAEKILMIAKYKDEF